MTSGFWIKGDLDFRCPRKSPRPGSSGSGAIAAAVEAFGLDLL
jgi:hypothetical protein